MPTRIEQYAEDHRYLLDLVARQAGFADPIAIDLDEFYMPLVKHAAKRELLPIDGVLVRDWDPDNRRTSPGFQIGMRLYDIEGVRFVRVRFHHNDRLNGWGLDFVAVDRKDYNRLYKIAPALPPRRRAAEQAAGAAQGPTRPACGKTPSAISKARTSSESRPTAAGPSAACLLTGSPGNGKTMACRWIWEACRQRRWEYRLVTPDSYRAARAHDSIEELFSVDRRGIIFFDDMDLALRDREKVHETEDQAVFLSAMDGITINEGVVFVFTTNCSPGPDRPRLQATGPARRGAAFQGARRGAAPRVDRALARRHSRPPRHRDRRWPRRTATASRRSRS